MTRVGGRGRRDALLDNTGCAAGATQFGPLEREEEEEGEAAEEGRKGIENSEQALWVGVFCRQKCANTQIPYIWWHKEAPVERSEFTSGAVKIRVVQLYPNNTK